MSVRIDVKAHLARIEPMFEDKQERFLNQLALYGEGQAKHYAPVKTGHLRRSIHTKKVTSSQATYGTAVRYARFIEDGTKGGYDIVPKNKKALYWDGADHPVKRVKHPGIRGRKFMERSAGDVVDAIPAIAKQIF